MKQPDKNTLARILEPYGLSESSIQYLGGGSESSDGIVYSYTDGGKRRTLKIVSLPADDLTGVDRFRQRVEFARFLGENGISVAYPTEAPRMTGGLSGEEKLNFMSTTSLYIDGANPAPADLTPAFYEKWGELTGHSQAATKRYPVWKNLTGGKNEFGYSDEILSFTYDNHDAYTIARWNELERALDALPRTRDNYGFIHNDNHMMNIIHDGSNITQMDFDVATCHFFMCDIVTMLQNYFFEECGGFSCPLRDNAPILRALDAFLRGYERYNHLPDGELVTFDLFAQYRRLLLYTVMSGWLATVPQIAGGFRANIDNPPDILKGFAR